MAAGMTDPVKKVVSEMFLAIFMTIVCSFNLVGSLAISIVSARVGASLNPATVFALLVGVVGVPICLPWLIVATTKAVKAVALEHDIRAEQPGGLVEQIYAAIVEQDKKEAEREAKKKAKVANKTVV